MTRHLVQATFPQINQNSAHNVPKLKPTRTKILTTQEIVLLCAIIVAPETPFSEEFDAVVFLRIVACRDLLPEFKLPVPAV